MNSAHALSESSPPAPPGAVDSFATELHSHQPTLQSWLRSRFPWLEDVEEIAQEAVFRLWRRQSKADSTPLRSPRAALFAIARNAAIDQARHRALAKTDRVAETAQLHVLHEGADVVDTVMARQELEFFAAAVRELPTRCRQVVTLTKIYSLTEREVAERLGISESTVRTQVVRGMERCTEYLRARGVFRGQR